METTVGVDMGGTRIKIGVVQNGALLATSNFKAPNSNNFKDNIEEIERQVDHLLVKTDSDPVGIGIAFPDIIDSDRMKILGNYVKYPGAKDFDFKKWAIEKWNIPLVLENDARAALVGEWQFGSGKGYKNLVLLTLGTGVGSAVLIDGTLLKGKNYLAGNLTGHSIINYDGHVCNCGNTGCLESEASSWGLEQKIKNSPDFRNSQLIKEKELSFQVLFSLASKGDALAIKIQNESIAAWATGIINLIHAYDPEKIIIAGGIMKSKEQILPKLINMVEQDSWIQHGSVDIVAATQVDFAGILGMSYIAKQLN